MSERKLVSPGTRLSAELANATKRPSADRAGEKESPSPEMLRHSHCRGSPGGMHWPGHAPSFAASHSSGRSMRPSPHVVHTEQNSSHCSPGPQPSGEALGSHTSCGLLTTSSPQTGREQRWHPKAQTYPTGQPLSGALWSHVSYPSVRCPSPQRGGSSHLQV